MATDLEKLRLDVALHGCKFQTRPKERGRLVACRASCEEKAPHRRRGFEVLGVVQITTIGACQLGAAISMAVADTRTQALARFQVRERADGMMIMPRAAEPVVQQQQQIQPKQGQRGSGRRA